MYTVMNLVFFFNKIHCISINISNDICTIYFPAVVAQTINSYIFRIHYKQIPMSIVNKIWQEKLPKI